MDGSTGDVTRLLELATGGDRAALDRLVPVVHDELHRIAARHMSRERRDHTLETTGLVNEAWMRLVEQERSAWSDRRHFFAIASTIMRRVLVNHARDRAAGKRGGGRVRVPLHEDAASAASGATREVDLLDLDAALEELGERDPRLARVVELRFFAGMSTDETAAELECDARTVKRYWSAARILLLDRLDADPERDAPGR